MERLIEEGTFKKGEWTKETITIYDENGNPSEIESYYFKILYQTVLASKSEDNSTNGLSLEDMQFIVENYTNGQLPTTDNENGETVVEITPSWQVGVAYSVGDVVFYDGAYFHCIQAHTSQADWKPTITPALWQSQWDS